jgi:hypothetical protein
MDCLICKSLERCFEATHSDYIKARSAAYYQVSTKIAARKNVEMERAKSNLEEHQLVCAAAAAASATHAAIDANDVATSMWRRWGCHENR